MAKDVESYIHRIGRTGRAGATGTSLTFWNPDYDKECAPALARILDDNRAELATDFRENAPPWSKIIKTAISECPGAVKTRTSVHIHQFAPL